MIKIPLSALSATALDGLIQAYVLREGTDYGAREYTLEEKCRAVRQQLERGTAEVWFEPDSGTTNIVAADS